MKTLKDYIAEFEKEFEEEKRGSLMLHDHTFFVSVEFVKSFLSSSLRHAIEEALKECRPEEKDLGWETITQKDREIKTGERLHNSCLSDYYKKCEDFLK